MTPDTAQMLDDMRRAGAPLAVFPPFVRRQFREMLQRQIDAAGYAALYQQQFTLPDSRGNPPRSRSSFLSGHPT